MEKFDFSLIVRQMGLSFACSIIGVMLGSGFASFLFIVDKDIIKIILSAWLKRVTFGVEYFGGDYRLWFIVNNLIAFMMIVVSIVLLVSMFIKRRKMQISYFKNYEEKHPLVTLYSLYMIPIGALIINSALVSLFLTFIFFDQGAASFSTAFTLMMPHGAYEFIALILTSSYGLAYIKMIKQFVLKKNWRAVVKTSKQIFFSQTSVIFIIMILILVVFGGIIEGSLSMMLK